MLSRYGIFCGVIEHKSFTRTAEKPVSYTHLEREMEKVLFAADELTGLIWAAALMRPSKSTKDMELKSLKKKYKLSLIHI